MLRDQRITESREGFNASKARLDEARAKVVAAEKALEDGRAETERALAGEAKARVDAAPRAGEILRKAQSLLGNVEGGHAIVAAEHERAIASGPSDATVEAHERNVGDTGGALAEGVAAVRDLFDAHARAAGDAEKDVQSAGLSGLARGRRQADEGLEMLERYSAAIVAGGWKR